MQNILKFCSQLSVSLHKNSNEFNNIIHGFIFHVSEFFKNFEFRLKLSIFIKKSSNVLGLVNCYWCKPLVFNLIINSVCSQISWYFPFQFSDENSGVDTLHEPQIFGGIFFKIRSRYRLDMKSGCQKSCLRLVWKYSRPAADQRLKKLSTHDVKVTTLAWNFEIF